MIDYEFEYGAHKIKFVRKGQEICTESNFPALLKGQTNIPFWDAILLKAVKMFAKGEKDNLDSLLKQAAEADSAWRLIRAEGGEE